MALMDIMSGADVGVACQIALDNGECSIDSDDVAAVIADDPESAAPEAREPDKE